MKDLWDDKFTRTSTDLFDCWHTNLSAGAWHVEGDIGQWKPPTRKRFGAYRQFEILCPGELNLSPDVMDRVAEMALCFEMLRDTLETWEADHAAHGHASQDDDGATSVVSDPIDAHSDGLVKMLSSSEETFKSCNDTLLRVVELSLGRSTVGPGELRNEQDLSDFGMQAMESGLGLADLLEAALGELTNYKLGPSSEERYNWRQWQQKYNRLAKTITKQKSKGQKQNSKCCTEPCVCQRAGCCRTPALSSSSVFGTTGQNSARSNSSSQSEDSLGAAHGEEQKNRGWGFCCMNSKASSEKQRNSLNDYAQRVHRRESAPSRSSVEISTQNHSSTDEVPPNPGSSGWLGSCSSFVSLFAEIQRRRKDRGLC